MKNRQIIQLILEIAKNISEYWKNRRKHKFFVREKVNFDGRKHYKSLKEISIKGWWLVMEGRFENLIIEGKYTNDELHSIYELLMQEYLDNFGTTDEYKLFLTRKMDYALALSEYIEEQNDYKKMLVEMAKTDFQDLIAVAHKKDNKPQSLESLMMLVEKKMGFQIDEHKMTAFKFYTYLKSE